MANTKYSLIADRYADALLDLAKDGKLSYEQISKDLNTVKDILRTSADLKEFLSNPRVSDDDKKEVIGKVFGDEVNGLTVNFLKILIDKKRFSAFDEIITEYSLALDEINKISRIQVTSAIDVNEDSRIRLKAKLEEKLQKTVALEWDINPAIIAGLVIRIGDNVIDTSLRHKLEDLSKIITR